MKKRTFKDAIRDMAEQKKRIEAGDTEGIEFIIPKQMIHTEEEYNAALKRIREIWEAKEGTPEFEELDRLCKLVTDYEEKHYPIDED